MPIPSAAPSSTELNTTQAAVQGAGKRVIVATGEMVVSAQPNVTLTTYALGSCVAVIIYDPVNHSGGLLHFMLPDSKIAADRAEKQPGLFADTGVALLLKQFENVQSGIPKTRIFLAGGACVLSGPDVFKIGARNAAKVTALMEAVPLPICATHLGGTINRSVHLDLSTGVVSVKLPDRTECVSLV